MSQERPIDLDSDFIEYAESLACEINDPLYSFDSNYKSYIEKRKEYELEWPDLPDEDKKKYGRKIAGYLNEKLKELPGSEAAKNSYLVNNECDARLNSDHERKTVDISLHGCDNYLLTLIEDYENVDRIKHLYRNLKNTSVSGINTEEANIIKHCLTQGRELYLAGKNGAIITKPLNFFYSITAYSYAATVLTNPIRYKLEAIPNSHGINHKLDAHKITFGGDTKRGTFSELFYSFPTEILKFPCQGQLNELRLDRRSSLKKFHYERFDTTLLSLLEMIPEMQSVINRNEKNSKTHPMSISIKAKSNGKASYIFTIGNGITLPNVDSIKRSFNTENVEKSSERFVVDVPTAEASQLNICCYNDIYGRPWYVESPFSGVHIPEMAIHFIIVFALSNIMRYRPDQWVSTLSNLTDPIASTLIKYYLTVFEQKFLFIILRSISNHFPVIDQAGLQPVISC